MAVENVTLVNKFGKMAGWNSVTANLLGRDLEGVQEIEYDDEQELENVYGAGAMPIGQGEGNYSAKGAIMLLIEERINLLDSLPAGARIQDLVFPIVVEYEYNGRIYTDKLNNCRIKNQGVAVKQNDKTIGFKHDLLVSHINWNV